MDRIYDLLSNKENELSTITQPFDFDDYFKKSMLASNMLSRFKTKKRVILNSAYRACPRPSLRNNNMTSSKNATCFICGLEFLRTELTVHEKSCLQNMQSNDIQYTRENTDEFCSPLSPALDTSSLSNHSASSSDSYEKKHTRCYICGTDVPTYLASIHEKNCKKNWETGLLNSICTPARKTNSRGDLSHSLSRGTSRTDVRIGEPMSGLKKSKSTTQLRKQSASGDDSNETSSNSRRNLSLRSKSVTNITLTNTCETRITDTKISSGMSKTKSLQDIRGTKLKADSGKKPGSNPQYVVCDTCGKLYSTHSIAIHQRQCERTIALQKNAGTDVDYKKKSKSLADLSKLSNKSVSRPFSATSVKKPSNNGQRNRPATANPLSCVVARDKTVPRNKDTSDDLSNVQKTPLDTGSPGLQKCYLCGQLYGSRSLPIHEKQCLKKWERNCEEEKQKKKNRLREIKLIPFGKSRHSEDLNGISPRSPNNILTPSKLFGVASPLNVTSSCSDHSEGKPCSESFENNLIRSALKSQDEALADHSDESLQIETNTTSYLTSNATSNPKFVLCIYCGRQYGQHSITIHEKSCRERNLVEEETRQRLHSNSKGKKKNVSAMKLSKSVGDISSRVSFQNGDVVSLVTCDNCHRKFLAADIEQHRAHCRVAVL